MSNLQVSDLGRCELLGAESSETSFWGVARVGVKNWSIKKNVGLCKDDFRWFFDL